MNISTVAATSAPTLAAVLHYCCITRKNKTVITNRRRRSKTKTKAHITLEEWQKKKVKRERYDRTIENKKKTCELQLIP